MALYPTLSLVLLIIVLYAVPSLQDGTVRLVGGGDFLEGRVEVNYGGTWSTVCDDTWDMNEAQVICRSLGFGDAQGAPGRAAFGEGSGDLIAHHFNCIGDEDDLIDCPYDYNDPSHCSHSEDAGVVCSVVDLTEAVLDCDSTSMTLIMERSLLDIEDGADSVHFEDESCRGYDHDSTHVAITTLYNRCGTQQEQHDDDIEFSNIVTYYQPRPVNGTNQLITREHFLHIPVSCYMEREQLLGEDFTPLIGVIIFEEVGYGEFTLSLERYQDSSFTQQADDSAQLYLGTAMYFGVNLTAVTDLTLLIESCWATPLATPTSDPQYTMIDDGCAADNTLSFHNYMGPTFKGFQIDAFTFIGEYDQVYVHCNILICDNSDPSSRCSQGCVSRSRRSLQPTGSRSKPHTISNGPLSRAQTQAMGLGADSDGTPVHSTGPMTIAAIGSVGVFIALVVLIAFMMMRMRTRPASIGYRQVAGDLPYEE